MWRQTANDTGCDGRTDCRVQGIFACFTPTAFDVIHKNIIFAPEQSTKMMTSFANINIIKHNTKSIGR